MFIIYKAKKSLLLTKKTLSFIYFPFYNLTSYNKTYIIKKVLLHWINQSSPHKPPP